ncbi:MAG: ketosteroid isomerase-related protein [Pseudomonadota bacterium]
MTAQDATAVIRRYFDAFNSGDLDAMLTLLSDDVRHDVNQGERRIGKHAFAEFCSGMNTSYKETARDLVIMASEDGGRAAAEFVIDGTYLETYQGLPDAEGQSYELPVGSFFEIQGGKITRVTTYYNMTDWTWQVGGAAA